MTSLAVSDEAFYFFAIMTVLAVTFAGCFLIVACGYSCNEKRKGESFKSAFAYFWHNF